MTPIASFWCFYSSLWTYFTLFLVFLLLSLGKQMPAVLLCIFPNPIIMLLLLLPLLFFFLLFCFLLFYFCFRIWRKFHCHISFKKIKNPHYCKIQEKAKRGLSWILHQRRLLTDIFDMSQIKPHSRGKNCFPARKRKFLLRNPKSFPF